MRLYECDWCHDLFDAREQVAHLDVTVGQVSERAHICAACAPDWLVQEFPEERSIYAEGQGVEA